MLGPERGTARVVCPDSAWNAAFEDEKLRLVQQLGHLVLDIQHVGSTAVPGLDLSGSSRVHCSHCRVVPTAGFRRISWSNG